MLWCLDEQRDDALGDDSIPWNALPGQMTQLDGSEWRLTGRPERLVHSYTLEARR